MDVVALLRQRIFLVKRDDAQFAPPLLRAAGKLRCLQQAAQFALAIFRSKPRTALNGVITGHKVAFPLMRCSGKGGGGAHATQCDEHGILQLKVSYRKKHRCTTVVNKCGVMRKSFFAPFQ